VLILSWGFFLSNIKKFCIVYIKFIFFCFITIYDFFIEITWFVNRFPKCQLKISDRKIQ